MASSLRDLIPELYPYASALVDAASSAGYSPRVTSTVRTHSEQARLYRDFLARGKTGLPAAPPGTSAHEYGWAFDCIFSPYEGLAEGGKYWRSLGGVWFPSDPVHFEYPGFQAALKASGVTADFGNGTSDLAAQYRAAIEEINSLSSTVGSFITPIVPSVFITLAPSVQKKELDIAKSVAEYLANLFTGQ
jgi:hypothetical protein